MIRPGNQPIKKNKLEGKIVKGKGLFGLSSKNKIGSLKSFHNHYNREEKRITICAKCKQELGKGKRHRCDSSSTYKNLLNFVSELPKKNRDQIVHNIINQDAANKSNSNLSIELQTAGRPLPIKINPKSDKDVVQLTHKDIDNLQDSHGLSNTETKNVTHWLHSHFGKKSVQPYYNKHIHERGKQLEDLYHVENLQFTDSKGNTSCRYLVYANSEDLLTRVCKLRDLKGHVFAKVMIDGGKGFLKVSLSVLPYDYNPISEEVFNNDSDESDDSNITQENKLVTNSKSNKITSVKKLVLLAIVPDIDESHSNLETIIKKTELNKISFILAVDFKLLLIVLGLQNAVSTYPCPYCLISLNDIRNLNKVLYDEEFETPQDRTFGNLKYDCHRFQGEFYGKRKNAKYCHSTINPSLILEDDNILVLSKCPMDELHVLEGIVNHIFFKGLVIAIGKENAMKWPKKLNVVSVLYQGEKFEGNGCRKLIKSSNILQDKEIMGAEVHPLIVQPYIAVFQALDKIISACFGSHPVKGDIPNLLRHFSKTYLGLGISVTLKVHIIIAHLIPCLMNLKGQGLGIYSTQAGESIHKEFNQKFWARYKVNSLTHPAYGERLLKATVDFSSKHL